MSAQDCKLEQKGLLYEIFKHVKTRQEKTMSSGEFDIDDFYQKFGCDYSPLDIHTAASLGDLSYFVKLGFGNFGKILSTPNQAGWTPLMYACSKGHSSLVKYLLLSGAKRDCKSDSGVTPLMLAISSGDMSTVEIIFDLVNLEDKDYRKWTPLFYSLHFSREKCLNFFLNKGANVNIVDFQNETPLMVAIRLGRETMVELILKTATNLEVTSYKQETALMLAMESKNAKILSLVRKRVEYLKNTKTLERPLTPTTPKIIDHCSPTPLKQQIKAQLSQMKMSKSFTYSPNEKQAVKRRDFNPWKFAFPRKFWSPQSRPHNDVENFLKSLGLEKYWPIFRDEEVDFETLLTLNEENLKELGIVLFGPRKKIYLAIQELKNRY